MNESSTKEQKKKKKIEKEGCDSWVMMWPQWENKGGRSLDFSLQKYQLYKEIVFETDWNKNTNLQLCAILCGVCH